MRVKGMVIFMVLSISAIFAAVAHGAESTDGKVKVATCNDGATLYKATNEHRGACRGHGGVATWADGSTVRHKGGSSTYVK